MSDPARPARHPRERERLAALARYGILDTPRESDFDDIASLAIEICGTPIAMVNLVAETRQWFKAEVGLGVRETPLDVSFCAHTILEQDFMEVEDTTRDARFASNPLVTGEPGLRFYAGALLRTAEGLPIGTLCVLDTRARTLTEQQGRALRRLARQVMAQLELRRAMVEQADDRAQLRAILESATDTAIIATDAAGRVTHWNRGAENVLGWSEAAALGQDLAMISTPEDRAAGVPDAQVALADAQGQAPAERWKLRRDGSRFFAYSVTTPLREGAHAGHLTILRDQTPQREAELAQRKLADSVPALIAYVDRDEVYRLVNQVGADWFGMPVEAMVGRSVRAAVGDVLYGARKGLIDRVLAGEHVRFDTVMQDVSGRRRVLAMQYVPRRRDDGVRDGFFVLGLDITERKRLEEALRALNTTLETQVRERTRERDQVWTHAQDLLVVVDLKGVFRAANPAWTATLGWLPEEVVGRGLADFIHPDDQASTQDALATPSRTTLRNYANRYRHKDGGYRWIAWVASAAGDAVFANGRDVTEERARAAALEQAQDALRQAQKMEAVGQLTGGVAHDFNNLLTIIRSSSELLRRPDLAPERRQRYIDAIAETVDRAARLTGQLLAFARRQALKPEVFDVDDRVSRVMDMLRTVVGGQVRIVLESDCEVCTVLADVNQFETALVNMVVNARDAMDAEGVLTIRVERVRSLPAIRGQEGEAGDYVAVTVSDTGAGIGPEHLPRIFEPFFTTKEIGRGTGLGLSQVYGFAKQSGGDVAVVSEPGQGATFTLFLPRKEGVPAGASPHTAASTPGDGGEGRRVLVVEDNVEVGRFSTRLLQDLDYATTWAASGQEALALLEESEGAGFDAVFSDVVMPGMSGVELALEIRRRWPALPTVLTSGYSPVLADEGLHGFELLQKPYSIEALSRVLWAATRRTDPPPD